MTTKKLTLDQQIGCRVQLNPNAGDLRCGDRVNGVTPNDVFVHLCEMCKLRKQNATLLEMLNRKRP